MTASADRVALRTCPLCEAMCGLELTLRDERVAGVRGDDADVLSRGYLCPKGASLGALHDDPDRLRAPLVRGADGELAEATWDEAFAAVDHGLRAAFDAGGRDAVALYLGNPSAHSLGPSMYSRALAKAIGSHNIFSASTVDQFPKQMASALMFGTAASVPVPDVDRTDFLLVLGANPIASNGSLLTAPNLRGRLQALRARGGRLVVVDPRRTRTARAADEHLFIRPGTDALLLFAIVSVLFAEGLVTLGALDDLVAGVDEVRALATPFTPEAVAPVCGIPAARIEALARGLAAAPSAAVYGRIGTTTQTFGVTTSWLIDVVNTLTGNLDRVGGAMFAWPATGGPHVRACGEEGNGPGRGRGVPLGRFASRVRGRPELFGELPVACLAEEIDTPGSGQVRALVTVAGNPVLSTPDSLRLDAALASLDFMVSVDLYVNETTRHADVILPSPSPLEKAHYELLLYGFAIRDVANYSPAVLDRPEGMPDEWETMLRLVGIAAGAGPSAELEHIDRMVALEAARREAKDPASPIAGLDPEAVIGALGDRRGTARMLDLLLRCGPYGAGLPELDAPGPGDLALAVLEANPHGIDFGPLQPRLPGLLRTPSGRVELAPEALVADVDRLRELLDTGAGRDAGAAAGQHARGATTAASGGLPLLLVGRRDVRSNNSWMHNIPKLVAGPERCTVWVHPDDARALGLVDGEAALVRSRVGTIEVPVEVTDDVMSGVVSIPHGWGHRLSGSRLGVASAVPGANSNVLTDGDALEPLSGTAVLNGIPVALAPSSPRAPLPVT